MRILFLALLVAQPLIAVGEALKIGVMVCTSGDCAEWGTNSLHGVQLAAEQINARGGILGKNIELAVQDSAESTAASRATTAFQNLTMDDEIHYIIGPTWTVGGMALVPMINRNKNLLVISPSVGLKEFNEGSDRIFNTWPHDEKATRELARYAISQKLMTAGIMSSQDPWVTSQSDIFQEEFVSLGGKIVSRQDPLPSSRDLRSEALRVSRAKPQVIFLSNYQYDVIAKELATLHVTAPKLSILMEKDRVKSAAGGLEGTVFGLYEAPTSQFKKSFQDKFGKEPGITADTAYDALMLIAKTAEEAKSLDVIKIKDSLHAVRDYAGASGKFSFDEKGAVDKAPVLWQIVGTDYVKVNR